MEEEDDSEAIDDVSALRISVAIEERQRAAKCFDAALEARLECRVEAQSLQVAETELLRAHHASERIAAPPPEEWTDDAKGFNDDIDAGVFTARTNRLFMRASRELKLYEGELENPRQAWRTTGYPSDHPLKAIRWWTSDMGGQYRPYPITSGQRMTGQNRSALFDVFWEPIRLLPGQARAVRNFVVGRGSVIIHAFEEPPPMGYPTNSDDFEFEVDYRVQIEYWFTACGLNAANDDVRVRGPLLTPPMHVFFNYDKFARKTNNPDPKPAMFTREKVGRTNLLEGRDLANAPASQQVQRTYRQEEVVAAVNQAKDLKSYFFTRYFLRPWVHTARLVDAERRRDGLNTSPERWGCTGGIYTGMSPSWQYEQKARVRGTDGEKQNYMRTRGLGSTLEHIIPQGAPRDAMMHQNDAIGQSYVPHRYAPGLPALIDAEFSGPDKPLTPSMLRELGGRTMGDPFNLAYATNLFNVPRGTKGLACWDIQPTYAEAQNATPADVLRSDPNDPRRRVWKNLAHQDFPDVSEDLYQVDRRSRRQVACCQIYMAMTYRGIARVVADSSINKQNDSALPPSKLDPLVSMLKGEHYCCRALGETLFWALLEPNCNDDGYLNHELQYTIKAMCKAYDDELAQLQDDGRLQSVRGGDGTVPEEPWEEFPVLARRRSDNVPSHRVTLATNAPMNSEGVGKKTARYPNGWRNPLLDPNWAADKRAFLSNPTVRKILLIEMFGFDFSNKNDTQVGDIMTRVQTALESAANPAWPLLRAGPV